MAYRLKFVYLMFSVFLAVAFVPPLTAYADTTTYSYDDTNHVVTISSGTQNSYSITASAGAGGAITPSGTIALAGGSSQTYTITPSSGYQIASVIVAEILSVKLRLVMLFGNMVTWTITFLATSLACISEYFIWPLIFAASNS